MSQAEKEMLEALGDLIEATRPHEYSNTLSIKRCRTCNGLWHGEKLHHAPDCAWDKAVAVHALHDDPPLSPADALAELRDQIGHYYDDVDVDELREW